MIFHRRAPRAWVFAADHDAVQLCWRSLAPGSLRIEVRSGPRAVAPALDLELGGDRPLDAAAGAVELTGLPVGRLLEVHLSGSAVGTPQVVVARTLPPPPGPELGRLATISDLHLGTTTFGQRGTLREGPEVAEPHPWRCAEAAIDEAATWGAERIVAKGDLTHAGLPHQWRSFVKLVDASPVPVLAMAGNHDGGTYGGRRALTPEEAGSAFGLDLPQRTAVHDLPGLRLVLADTTIPFSRRGSIHPAADEVVQAAADAPPEVGVLVVLHHHLHPHPLPDAPPIGIGHQEGLRFLDRLGSVHRHVLVTSGHTHRNRRWGRAGVAVTQVGATKDYPGVWAGYRIHEGGLSQVVRRIERPDCVRWTEHSRLAALGLWEHASPGRLDSRCFALRWTVPATER